MAGAYLYYKQLTYARWYGLAGLVILLSWGYYITRVDHGKNFPPLAPREAILTLKVDHVFAQNSEKQTVLGTAVVYHAPLHLKAYEGKRVYFQARNPLDIPVIKTQLIESRAVLSDLRNQEETTDFNQYLLRSEVHLGFTRGTLLREVTSANAFFRFFNQQNERFERILRQHIDWIKAPNGATAVYIAMLLGNKVYLSQEQKDIFKQSGTLHLFAISGLHVGVIAGCLAYILGLMRLPRKVAAIIGLSCLLYYVFATGASPSAMRAYLMVLFFWGAYFFARKPAPFSALLASAICTLVWNPLQLWNIGFQLSYLVVGAILLYGLPLYEWINIKLRDDEDNKWINNRFIHGAIGLLAISIAATLGSAPLSMMYFHITTPGGILINLLLMPMASIVIVTGCVSLIVGIIGIPILSLWMGSIINMIAVYVIAAMEAVIPWSFHIKGLFFRIETPSLMISIGFLLLLFAWLLWGHARNKLNEVYYYTAPVLLLTMITAYEVLKGFR